MVRDPPALPWSKTDLIVAPFVDLGTPNLAPNVPQVIPGDAI